MYVLCLIIGRSPVGKSREKWGKLGESGKSGEMWGKVGKAGKVGKLGKSLEKW